MGNASKKLAAKCTLLSRDEQKVIANAFRQVSRNSDKIREDDLVRLWGPQIDPRLMQYLSKFMFDSGVDKTGSADFLRFAELYVFSVRGTLDERLKVMYSSLGLSHEYNEDVPYQLLKEYCESIASTYIKTLKTSGSRRAQAWVGKGFRGRPLHVQALGEALAVSIVAGDERVPSNLIDSYTLKRGLENDMLLKLLLELVIRHLYGATRRQPMSGEDRDGSPVAGGRMELLPAPCGLEVMPDYPAFVDLTHITWINCHLPCEHRHKWRFLFSTHIHGESFSTMMGRIVDNGPSVLIIEDADGYMFGGYAARSWLPGPNFTGTEDAFLFTLAPRMRCYPATGYNDHYQYINTNQKTMPNGLLMGGQFEYGGIWLDYEFGQGTSAESCSTFRGYRQLSKEKSFVIRSLEVWGVGDKPLTVTESATSVMSRHSTVLETHRSDRNMLKVMGKAQYSDGFRQ